VRSRFNLTDYLEISIYIFGYNVFRNGLVLTINHVHVQLSFVTFKERSELFRTFQTTFQSFEEKTVKKKAIDDTSM